MATANVKLPVCLLPTGYQDALHAMRATEVTSVQVEDSLDATGNPRAWDHVPIIVRAVFGKMALTFKVRSVGRNMRTADMLASKPKLTSKVGADNYCMRYHFWDETVLRWLGIRTMRGENLNCTLVPNFGADDTYLEFSLRVNDVHVCYVKTTSAAMHLIARQIAHGVGNDTTVQANEGIAQLADFLGEFFIVEAVDAPAATSKAKAA